jgi:hypothetical protein
MRDRGDESGWFRKTLFDIGLALLVELPLRRRRHFPMRISLGSRAARICAASTLVFAFSFAPSYARMGGGASFGRPAFGAGHSPRFAPRGFNRRLGFGRFGSNRFGSKRLDRFSLNRSGRFGNPLLIGGWDWDGWGSVPVSTGVSEPIILGGGAPVIINIGGDWGPRGAGYAGGCVIHKLIYDSNGKYAGERQTPQC